MKKNIDQGDLAQSVFLLQPSRPILCTTINTDGSLHVAPFSWINPVSHKPPRVAMALLNKPKKQNSLVNIERTGEFVVNVPSLELAEKLVECSYLIKEGENKFRRAGFNVLPSVKVSPPGIQECKAHLECKVINSLDAGDHILLVADILQASYEEGAYSSNLLINLERFTPAIHILNYVLDKSQVHVFLKPCGSHTIEVPYPDNQ
ncbi:MAG: flavin reductase family protein [Clostridia bacterium]|jgi:flavin reductase (DIM6/NTAB) family NADH-FMN oxidoreductase RutF|nr:flavin reductase family protein [Clostridia bacterium]